MTKPCTILPPLAKCPVVTVVVRATSALAVVRGSKLDLGVIANLGEVTTLANNIEL